MKTCFNVEVFSLAGSHIITCCYEDFCTVKLDSDHLKNKTGPLVLCRFNFYESIKLVQQEVEVIKIQILILSFTSPPLLILPTAKKKIWQLCFYFPDVNNWIKFYGELLKNHNKSMGHGLHSIKEKKC